MPKTEPAEVAATDGGHGPQVDSGELLELLIGQAAESGSGMAQITAKSDGRSEKFLVIVAGLPAFEFLKTFVCRVEGLEMVDFRAAH